MRPNSDTTCVGLVCAQRCMTASMSASESTADRNGRVMAKMSAHMIPTPHAASAVRDWKKTVSS